MADRGRLDKAFEHFRKAIELQPDNAMTHYNLGMVYQTMGLNDKTEEQFQKAKALNLHK